ncbi:MAG: hypothetical protein K6E99_04335 [Bacilli bacterium]|nr:hypothetical protein [Bacilli bacterium]
MADSLGTISLGTAAISTLGPTVESTMGDEESQILASVTTTTATPTTTTAQSINYLSADAAVQTAQAVSYVETYNQEEIDELVAQIDLVLEEQNSNQDVYVKSLRK